MTFITSYYNLWWCWGLKYVTLAEELKKKNLKQNKVARNNTLIVHLQTCSDF